MDRRAFLGTAVALGAAAMAGGARERVPEDLSRQPWHQRLTRWLAWTWPFVALAWLLARLVQRGE